MKDAKVICRRLGFDGALAASRAAAYGQGSGEIFLDNVGCDGTEDKIADCFHLGVGIHDCEHANDAGVKCFSGTGNLIYDKSHSVYSSNNQLWDDCTRQLHPEDKHVLILLYK